MKICVSLNESNFENYLASAKLFDFIELRLDLYNFSDNKLSKILALNKKTIVSFLGDKSSNFKFARLKKAINLGADFIDIDDNLPNNLVLELIEYSKNNNCKSIVSYHNFKCTPNVAELKKIINNIKSKNSNYIKISCFANELSDNKITLSLYNNYSNLIAFNMGKLGKNSRIESIKLGAPFTYASSKNGKETASGQFSYYDLKNLI